MQKDVIIRAENISKAYKLYEKKSDRLREAISLTKKKYHRPFHALQDISFEVYRGETLGIIGTNGSGKSTLLKILTGVVAPTSGSYQIDGTISALLELGAGFNPEYTGLENISLTNTMLGLTEEDAQKRLQEIVEFADIGEYITQPVKNYSSGMFARLAFAVAISAKPDVLIVDETLSVGDVFFQNKCFKKFDELKRNGVTILFVSHDTGTVRQLCSRVLWIEQGVQQMIGDSKEVCNAYANSIRVKSAGKNPLKSSKDEEESEYVLGKFSLEDVPKICYSKESQLHQDVTILSSFLRDKRGNIVTELNAGEEYTFTQIFHSAVDIPQCITGFVIESAMGQWVVNCNSAICGKKKPFPVKAHTTVKTEYLFSLPKLLEGEYVIGTAVSKGTMSEFEVLTWLYQIMNVSVINTGANSAIIDVDAQVDVYYATSDSI